MTAADEEALVAAASAVRRHAHAPYSGLHVGAAVRTTDGRVVAGANVENASYPVGLCAERSAVAAAVSSGATGIVAVAVVADTERPIRPCGLCRQTLREFGETMAVVMVGADGARERTTLAALLPQSFGPEDLPPRPR